MFMWDDLANFIFGPFSLVTSKRVTIEIPSPIYSLLVGQYNKHKNKLALQQYDSLANSLIKSWKHCLMFVIYTQTPANITAAIQFMPIGKIWSVCVVGPCVLLFKSTHTHINIITLTKLKVFHVKWVLQYIFRCFSFDCKDSFIKFLTVHT